MKKLKILNNIKIKLSDKIAFGIVTGYSVFHLLILIGILPRNIVWGGKIIEPKTILYLEFASLFIMLFLGFLILIKTKIVQWNWQINTINRWLFAFAIAGLSICAAFMAAIASAIDDPNHSGKSGLMMLPLVPVALTFFLIDAPNSVITVFLSYLPITSFAVMPVRMSLVELAVWEPILSLIFSLVCFYYFRNTCTNNWITHALNR